MAFIADTPTVAQARAEVIVRLLGELEDTVVEINALPSEQRDRVLVQDAEKITARVSQVLTRARGQLGLLPIPQRLSASSLSESPQSRSPLSESPQSR
jgi:hypothetical protein